MLQMVSHRTRWSGRAASFIAVATAISTTAFAFTQCSDSTGPDQKVLEGPEIAVGQGTVRTNVSLDRGGNPVAIAVVFDEAALQGLPATAPLGGIETIIPLPPEATSMPFNHLAINWQPAGHPPLGIYNRPHFDVHFYMLDMQQRNAMLPSDPQFAAKVARQPIASAVPPNYVSDGIGIPRMGSHWNDRNAPEHHGQKFTHTLIYGFFDGQMVFIEPMVTKEFLDAKTSVTVDLSVPAQYPAPGFYPTRYAIRYAAQRRQHRVELLSFVRR